MSTLEVVLGNEQQSLTSKVNRFGRGEGYPPSSLFFRKEGMDMAFIISQSTFVTGLGVRGIVSVQLSLSPQIQRLYDIGFSDPFLTNIIDQQSMSITRYAPGPIYPTLPSDTCADANFLTINVAANACGSNPGINFTGEFFVNNYSYSKDVQSFGQESWSMITRPVPTTGADFIMVRGIAEGQTTPVLSGGLTTGVVLSAGLVSGEEVQVTAGDLAIGRIDEVDFGTVSQIGGGTGKFDGYAANGTVTIPYTPIPDI